jgi:hypothetical protein
MEGFEEARKKLKSVQSREANFDASKELELGSKLKLSL